MVRLPKHRPPTSPGRMLARALEERGLTQSELAKRIDVPFQRVNLIVNGKRAITADTALRLSRLFGTTPGLWMNAQRDLDLWHQARERQAALRRIHPVDGTAEPGRELSRDVDLARSSRRHSGTVPGHSGWAASRSSGEAGGSAAAPRSSARRREKSGSRRVTPKGRRI